MRVECTYFGVHKKPTKNNSAIYSIFDTTHAKLSRSAKHHLSSSAHLMMRFVLGLSIYIYQFYIPIDLQAQFPTCATREAGVISTTHTVIS
jgi:hypothetical protein